MKSLKNQVFVRTVILVLSAASGKTDHGTADLTSTATFSAEVEDTLKFVDAAVVNIMAKNLADDFKKSFKIVVADPVFEALALHYLFDKPCRKRPKNEQCENDMTTKLDTEPILLVHKSLNETFEYLKKKSIKLVSLKDLLDRMDRIDWAEKNLREIIVAYGKHDMSSVHGRIEELISEIERNECGSLLVQHLDTKFAARSVIDDLIMLGIDDREQTRWSTATMIFNIYMTVASYAFRENAILRVAYKLKNNANNKNADEDLTRISSNKNSVIKSVLQSLRDVNDKLDVVDCVQKTRLKPLSEDKIVRMKNFLQLYYLPENILAVKNTSGMVSHCRKSCAYWGSANICLNGCCGTARQCHLFPVDAEIGLILQKPQVDKIYTRILYEPEEFMQSTWDIYLGKKNRPSNCELCACVCDQHKLDTTRRFYARTIKAPTGYVVTGIRFVEKDRTIFLQIEVGKLLPLGMINQTSVEWQSLPDDADDYSVPLTHVHQIVLLNNNFTYKPDEVVTGFSFSAYASGGVELGMYKKKIHDFTHGHLGGEVLYRPPNQHEISAFSSQILDFSNKIPGLNLTAENPMNETRPIGIKFGISTGDFGQSCVPYFDGSDVTFEIKVPLADISFIRYTNDLEYAGYIRPLLRSIDYKNLFFSK